MRRSALRRTAGRARSICGARTGRRSRRGRVAATGGRASQRRLRAPRGALAAAGTRATSSTVSTPTASRSSGAAIASTRACDSATRRTPTSTSTASAARCKRCWPTSRSATSRSKPGNRRACGCASRTSSRGAGCARIALQRAPRSQRRTPRRDARRVAARRSRTTTWRVEVDAAGSVTLHAKTTACESTTLSRWCPRGIAATSTTSIRCRAVSSRIVSSASGCASRAAAEPTWRCGSRRSCACRANSRSHETRARQRSVALPVACELRLAAGLDRLDVALEVDNTARDHRLRLLCRAPFAGRRFEVESAFEIAERPIAPAPDSFGSSHPSEFPIGAVPQRTFATLADDGGLALTVANRGVAEVEAVVGEAGQGALALTVLRAVGWLSRADLRLRAGPAGPGLATPGAQVPGPHRAEFALRLHPHGDPRRIAEAHGFAYPPLGVRRKSTRRTGRFPMAHAWSRSTIQQIVVSASNRAATATPSCVSSTRAAQPAGLRLPGAARTGRSAASISVDARTAAPAFDIEASSAGAIALGPWQLATLRIPTRS